MMTKSVENKKKPLIKQHHNAVWTMNDGIKGNAYYYNVTIVVEND